jgi:hypothetical protein
VTLEDPRLPDRDYWAEFLSDPRPNESVKPGIWQSEWPAILAGAAIGLGFLAFGFLMLLCVYGC